MINTPYGPAGVIVAVSLVADSACNQRVQICEDTEPALAQNKKLTRSDGKQCRSLTEPALPTWVGMQDRFYASNLKGIGRIYQQTFVDMYPKVAHCKRYVSKTPITAADLLNDPVLSF